MLNKVICSIVVFALFFSSCQREKPINRNFEVTLTDSILFEPLNAYINKHLKINPNFEKEDVFTICAEFGYAQDRYILSFTSLYSIYQDKLPFEYYTFYNGHLILIYLSQYRSMPNEVQTDPSRSLYSENKPWQELIEREKERFEKGKMAFVNPDGMLIIKCTSSKYNEVRYLSEGLLYFIENENYNKFLYCEQCEKNNEMNKLVN